MKHPQYQRHRHYGAEWLQAMFTLLVLCGIYLSMGHFDSYSTKLVEPQVSLSGEATHSYWNESLGYGFSQNGATGSYEQQNTASGNIVNVSTGSGMVYNDSDVKVYFYKDTSIDSIQETHIENIPRTYSRLSNGIAVIEGNLASPEAKMILATLHSR